MATIALTSASLLLISWRAAERPGSGQRGRCCSALQHGEPRGPSAQRCGIRWSSPNTPMNHVLGHMAERRSL